MYVEDDQNKRSSKSSLFATERAETQRSKGVLEERITPASAENGLSGEGRADPGAAASVMSHWTDSGLDPGDGDKARQKKAGAGGEQEATAKSTGAEQKRAGETGEKEQEKEKEKVAHAKPQDADKAIQEEFGKIVKGLSTGKVAEGKINIVDDAKFRVVYKRYFGNLDEYDYTNAFVERDSPEGGDLVWVHEEKGNPGTVIHESIHLYSNAAFRTTYGRAPNEGATEYFTRIITDKKKVSRNNYDEELNGVKALVAATSLQSLADAYFSGSLAGLEKAAGESKFKVWLTAMKEGRYVDATKAFK